ncbi:hypothetical protein EDD25_2288 [Cryobacterium psychrophilum]|nr:hypothetical protein EDD25_2288 [Cryobacterium psychrophilum]
MDAEYDAPDTTSNPVEMTRTACGQELGCVEAYDTDEATYIRFESRDRAAEYGSSLDDGFVVNYIVMDFAGKDGTSPQHQRSAMEVLAGTWQDYHGTFPDR